MANRYGGSSLLLSADSFKKYAVVVSSVICLLVAIFMQSRAFTVGYAAGILFLLLAYQRFTLKSAYIVGGMIGLALLTVALALLLKTDSSAGRLLIYKISWAMFKEHYVSGIGFGRFKQQYGLYQAAYFKAGTYSRKELLLADNTYYAFNDYWQLLIELGLKGIGILLLYFVCLGKLFILSLKKHSSYPMFLLFVVAQLVAITVAASLTHVFEKLFFQLTVLFLLTVLCYFAYRHIIKVLYLIIGAALLAIWISYSSIQFYIIRYKQYQQWQEANESVRMGYLSQAKQTYAVLYPYLKQYPLFLDNYSSLLIAIGEYDRAQSLLSQLITEQTKNTYYSNLGDCYLQMHRIPEAGQAYQTSINIVPNRFTTRFALYQLYSASGQQIKARQCANEILNLPIKVPSPQITFMLNKIKQDMLISEGKNK